MERDHLGWISQPKNQKRAPKPQRKIHKQCTNTSSVEEAEAPKDVYDSAGFPIVGAGCQDNVEQRSLDIDMHKIIPVMRGRDRTAKIKNHKNNKKRDKANACSKVLSVLFRVNMFESLIFDNFDFRM